MLLQNQKKGDKDITSKSINILLIEDNEGDVRLIREMLKEAKNLAFKVEASGLLNKALKIFENRKFDAILLDLNLPDNIGIETASKTLEVIHDIPIIILTGLNEESLAISTVKMGVQDYLVKEQLNSMLLIRSIQYAIERKKTEQKLKESEEKYRLITENANDLIAVLDDKFRLEFINENPLNKMLGYNSVDYIGKSDFLVIHPDDRKMVLNELLKSSVVSEGIADARLRHKDGHYIWVESRGKPFIDGNGEKKILINIRNITDRKKKEEEIRLQSEIIENMSEGVNLIKLDDGTIVYTNPAFEEMFGYNPGEMIGRDVSIVNAPTEKAPEETRNEIVGILKEVGEWHGEVLNIKKDGTPFMCYANVSLFDHPKYGRVIVSVHTDITERKNTELKLKESEEKYKNLFEQSPMAILLINFEGKIEDCNTPTEVLFGYPKEELLGIDFLKFDKIPLDTKLILAKSFSKFLKTGVPEHSEIQMYRRDGKKIWIESYPIIVKISEILYILVVIQDITERKTAEEERNKFFNLSLHILLIASFDGIILQTNPGWEEILGYDTKELIGRPFIQLVHPDDRSASIAEMDKLSQGAITMHFENRYRKRDGSYRTLAWSAVPNLEKEVCYAIAHDITDKKETEIAIRESEEKYRILIETAVMGIVEFDAEEFKILYINPKLLEILGYTKEDLIVEKTFLKIIHPEDLKELIKSSEEKYIEFRIFTKDGKLKWLSGTKNNHFNKEGKLISARLWLQDSTESKEVEEIKSNLLTRFSHEFKTPLISIKGFADFLLTEHNKNLDDKTISFLKKIKDGGDRLKELVNTFIESSQLDNTLIKLKLHQENLSDLIKTCLEEMQGLINLRNHTINLDIHDQLNTSVDKEKIYSVITNLLLNAINYTPKGGKIWIESIINEGTMIFSVKDNGIGLDDIDKKQLFKPFGKIERYGKGWDIISEGMGMGLYLSKEIMNLHGGKIWVESKGISKGTTFYFSLPIVTN